MNIYNASMTCYAEILNGYDCTRMKLQCCGRSSQEHAVADNALDQ